MSKLILEFTVPVPKIGTGKWNNELVLMNNASKWIKWHRAKIRKEFLALLGEWQVPKSTENALSGRIEYRLYRPTQCKLDADSIAYPAKWCTDFITKQGYFLDDNQVESQFKPVIVEKDRVETEMKVSVYKDNDE